MTMILPPTSSLRMLLSLLMHLFQSVFLAVAPRGRLRLPLKDLSPEQIDNYARWVHVRWGHCGMAETNRRLSLGVRRECGQSPIVSAVA